MSELLQRLQTAVGGSYRIERELGGGGMSRVFLAEETRLAREVVIKVLPPEMAADVNVDRFEREIRLAARLQHPHIVPLLTAGASGDLLYYVMPFIRGESLRTRLTREGELPVAEATRILRDIADALAYAHREGVVHRDIKPDNVLLSDGHAVVTDFGVAKAVSASTTESSLTSLGVALGTPSYMAPEQAAAAPHVDHRADIYGVGVLAYEMLCGRPPFVGANAQAVLSAHIVQEPEPLSLHRNSVPPALAEVVMRCLAKKAADRWQRAADLQAQFEALATPTAGMTPTGTPPHPAAPAVSPFRHAHPVLVAALFGVASLAVLAVVYLAMLGLGLPGWVLPAALLLLLVGLPIVVMTGHTERRRAATGAASGPLRRGVHGWLTWRKALLGGVAAFAVLGVVTAVYMAMRALGIGPVGTLMASGALAERDRLILAAFENRTADSTLGSTVTDLFRVGMAQSPVITVLEPNQLTSVLARMEQDPSTTIDPGLAFEVAEREGLKGVLTGDVVSVGSGFVVSARLAAPGGEVLTAHQASAAGPDDLIAAVDQLAARIRERIGESLRTIRANEPLERVTTRSLDALRLYSQGLRAEDAGDDPRAVALFEEAIRVDSTFAMAYRKLGTVLRNNYEQRARAVEALTRAYELRDHLTDRERAYAASMYYMNVTGETERAIAEYATLLERYPDDRIATNNLGVLYYDLRDYERALEFYRRGVAIDSSALGIYNLAGVETILGRFADAEATIDLFAERVPRNPRVAERRIQLAFTRRDYAAAEAMLNDLREEQRGSPFWRQWTSSMLARVATLRGRLRDAGRQWDDARAAAGQRDLAAEVVNIEMERAINELFAAGWVDAGNARIGRILGQYPLESLPPHDRPYYLLILFWATAGDPGRARAVLADFEIAEHVAASRDAQREVTEARGLVALASGEYDRAIDALHRADDGPCMACSLVLLARAYDAAGRSDSAVALWERFATTNARWAFLDSTELPTAHRRAGQLYEQLGERQKAIEHYNAFLEMWRDADPELQPVVEEVRARLARLVGEDVRG